MFKKLCKKFHYGQKGFTLIELLVVVAILGVLAAVAIPNVSKFVKSGTLAAANTEVATVQTAAIAYAADNNPPATGFTNVELNNSTYLNKTLTGTYSFDNTGALLSGPTASVPSALEPKYGSSGLFWNSATQQFQLTALP